MILVVCLVAALIFLLYLRWENSTYVKTIDLIPGPPKVPVVGNALLVPRNPHGKKQSILSYFNLFVYIHLVYINRFSPDPAGKMAQNIWSHIPRMDRLSSFYRHFFSVADGSI